MTLQVNNQVFYTTTEFAELMRYADERPVRSAINRGDIPAVTRLDGRKLIPAWYVERVLKNTGGNRGDR